MLGKDLIMQTLLGGGSSGGGSSGGGGGSAAVSPKEVNFYDYDGTCVHAYTVAEAQALSELPAGPEHPGLVFQGWNWSLEGVKGLTRAMNIGAMYTTDDGTTRLYITLQEGRTSPMLGVCVNGTVTVDWGDGTEPDVLTGTSLYTVVWTPNHNYAAPGDYVIRLTVTGSMRLYGSSNSRQYAYILRYSSGADDRNQVYQNALRRVEIGDNAKIGSYAFDHCKSLTDITIPNGVISIDNYVFRDCMNLYAIIIPDSVTSIGSYAFSGDECLGVVVISNGVENIGDQALCDCVTLFTMTIPYSVKKISSYAASGCKSLTTVAFPDGVQFNGGYVFSNCTGMAYYDFTHFTAVPAIVDINVFGGIPADCEIRVPAALYDEWIAATNWATYASYIKAY